MSGTVPPRTPSAARLLRAPNLAARASALGSLTLDQKFVFGAIFRGTMGGRSFVFHSDGDTDAGFAVRSISKPDVEIDTEELNQYNKKRLAVKGVKYKPMTITLYDRADALAGFLDSYLGHYIGDFSQPSSSWSYDVVSQEMISATDKGFGFGTVPGTPDEQFVLNEIVIVRGVAERGVGGRTMMTLVRPRITDIDYDDMDYSSSDPVMITLTVMFEALLFGGGSGDTGEAEVVRRLDGRALDLPNEEPRAPPRATGRVPGNASVFGRPGLASFGGSGWRTNSGGLAGGVLGAFGGFDFGRLAGSIVTRAVTGAGTRGLGNELAFSATGNPALATLLNSTTSRTPLADFGNAVLGSVVPPSSGIGSAAFDVARASVSGAGRGNQAGFVAGNLVTGLLASRDLRNDPTALPVRNGRASLLTAEDYAVLNARGNGTAQYGVNSRTVAPPPTVTREPLPPLPPLPRL